MIWIQCVLTECIDGVHISHIFQIFVIPCFDFLNLMRSTETIEEVNERNFSFDSCKMCNRSQVHNFLYRRFTQHSCTSLTACIYVRVITKNRKCVACQGTSGYVEYAWKLFAGNFVKVWNHQQKTLRSCISSCQSTCCQGTVYCTCCTGFGLHLSYLNFLSENVLSSLSSPFIGSFSHNG